MRRITFLLLAASSLAAASASGQELRFQPGSDELRALPKQRALATDGAALGTGTIQYDPGAPADALLNAPLGVHYFGNVFNSRTGSPLSPGTITQVSWYQGAPGFSPFALGFVAPPNSGSVATLFVASSPASFQFNTVPAAANSVVGSSFWVGMGEVRVATGQGSPAFFGSVGLRSASTNGQGFHGASRNASGGIVNPLSASNVMVRVAGNIIIPVELLEFEIE